MTRVLASALKPLQELVSGFDFLTVVSKYYQAFLNQNQTQQDHAFVGFAANTQLRQRLGKTSVCEPLLRTIRSTMFSNSGPRLSELQGIPA